MNLVIIGGGPGGYVAAIRAAQLGASVTLIEKDQLGGTCLNVGCIPTKALLHTAELYKSAKESKDFGVLTNVQLDFHKAQQRKQLVVNKLTRGVKGLLDANKVKVVQGIASFVDSSHIQVLRGNESSVFTFDQVIVASGSVPMMPSIPGIDSKQCVDSTGALGLETLPESMLIVGGGVIGVEMATIFNTLGCKVTIIEMLPSILPLIDEELSDLLTKKLKKEGMAIYTSSKVESIIDRGNHACVKVKQPNGEEIEIDAKKVLISIGRKINTDSLNLDHAGIAQMRGKILVDNQMRTNVKGIYAIGDCTGGCMLAHVASMQGEVAAENAMGANEAFELNTNPSCVYSDPEIGSVGLTERQAKEQKLDYTVGKFPLSANSKSMIMQRDGMVKLIIGKEFGQILGAHIIGPRATDMIAECALMIKMEATIDEVIATIHAHPTVSESIREAALAADRRAIHILNR
jgi:dihydrolipoamide dehydrogenase